MCLHNNSSVLETRTGCQVQLPGQEHLDINFIRRRRVCSDCDYRWTTYEVDSEVLSNISSRRSQKDIDIKNQIDALKQAVKRLSRSWS